MRVQSVLVKTSQAWSTSNTEAYWHVLLTSIKLYILTPSLMVDMEYVIPFTAPPIPISICLLRLGVIGQKGRGEGGRPFGLWVFRAMLRSSCPC